MSLFSILALIGVIVIVLVLIYNNLVGAKNMVENAFGSIDAMLKKRYDLIPNLVEVAKGYMGHERDTLEAVVAARGQAVNASAGARATPGDPAKMQALLGAESSLTSSLGRLFAVVESYPDLKANQNMMSLQEELTSTENKVGFARQAFNDAVTAFNNQRQVFPTVVVANLFNFTEASLLETPVAEREAPKVKF